MRIDDFRVAVFPDAGRADGVVLWFSSAVLVLSSGAAADLVRSAVADEPKPGELTSALTSLVGTNDLFATMAAVVEGPAPLVLVRGAVTITCGDTKIIGSAELAAK